MTIKAPATQIIRGKQVNSQTIGAIAGRFAGQSADVTVWANYCALHAVKFHNFDALKRMLQNPAFLMASGKPSKLGRDVLAYIQAHAPQIKLDDDTGAPRIPQMSDANPLKGHFQNPAELGDNGKPTIVEPGDFALTFDEWRNLEKVAKEPTEPKVKASTVAKKLAEVKTALAAGKLVASAEELAELAEAAKALFLALDSQHSAEAAKVEPVDAEKNAELLKSGQGGKATRAGKKVAAV